MNSRGFHLLRGTAVTIAMAGLLASQQSALATVAYSGGTYSQNFDSLTTTTHNSSAATFDAWSNDSTLAGWHLFQQPAPGTAITQYKGGTGTVNAGFFYSFGATGVAERALGGIGAGSAYFGSPAAGAIAGWIALGITNNTATITSFSIEYDGEQWREGGTINATPSQAQTMVLEYGFGATFSAVSSWTAPGGTFDFTSPVFGSASPVALDGNLAANRAVNRGGTISDLAWNPGETLWIRWVERNDPNNDHALAIDDFQFTATVVPEPSSMLMAGLGSCGLAVAYRRWRRREDLKPKRAPYRPILGIFALLVATDRMSSASHMCLFITTCASNWKESQ